MYKFTTVLENMNSNLWGGHITVPLDIAEQILSKQEDRRVVCTINEKLRFQCALMPNGNGGYFILVNKSNRKKMGLRLGEKVFISLEKDGSKYGLPMPEEMAEVLASDPDGNDFFEALTPGKQRNLLYIVGKVKSSELRIRKALVVIEHLKTQGGKIDFKQLNEDLKATNRKY